MPRTALEHLDQLLQGNAHFVAGAAAIERAQLALGQEPFAVILGCSDSRVPVETVFDRGPGEIFVVRVAGNVISPEVLGSIEYAVEVLKTSLVLVLGHSSCGAVAAALDHVRAGAAFPGSIDSLVEKIAPAVAPHAADESSERAVDANVRQSVRELEVSPVLARAVEERRIAIRGAVYDLATGAVRML